jgi:hypothetical protein
MFERSCVRRSDKSQAIVGGPKPGTSRRPDSETITRSSSMPDLPDDVVAALGAPDEECVGLRYSKRCWNASSPPQNDPLQDTGVRRLR